jgi:hypothetical protein
MGFPSCGGLPVAGSSAFVPQRALRREVLSSTLKKVFVVIVIGDDYSLKASFQTSPHCERGADIGDGLVFPGYDLFIE